MMSLREVGWRSQALRRTCGALLEFLIFLFPPLPGLENSPQGGQLAVTSDGWSVNPRHQAACSQHPLLVHKFNCSNRRRCREEAQRREEIFVCLFVLGNM